jgi:hypothetical protein
MDTERDTTTKETSLSAIQRIRSQGLGTGRRHSTQLIRARIQGPGEKWCKDGPYIARSATHAWILVPQSYAIGYKRCTTYPVRSSDSKAKRHLSNFLRLDNASATAVAGRIPAHIRRRHSPCPDRKPRANAINKYAVPLQSQNSAPAYLPPRCRKDVLGALVPTPLYDFTSMRLRKHLANDLFVLHPT